MNVWNYINFAVCAAGAMLFASCSTVPASTWIYQPGENAKNGRATGARVAVTPFDDDRRLVPMMGVNANKSPEEMLADAKKEVPEWSGLQLKGMENFCILTGKWLALELESAKRFASVRYTTWEELSKWDALPDTVITGVMKALPAATQSVELRVLDPRAPTTPVWSKDYSFKQLPRKLAGPLGPTTYIMTSSLVQPTLRQMQDDLAEALAPGGAARSRLTGGR